MLGVQFRQFRFTPNERKKIWRENNGNSKTDKISLDRRVVDVVLKTTFITQEQLASSTPILEVSC
jgi:hypothetical protein